MAGYGIRIIPRKEKERLWAKLSLAGLGQAKASIYGACVKLFCDSPQFVRMWKKNFSPMPECIRPHARIFALGKNWRNKNEVLYEPESKTAFLFGCKYYGMVKSVALGAVGDYLEDCPSEHKRFSVHGSCVSYRGMGIGMIGFSGSGKTTLTYGLLSSKSSKFVADDWFFVKIGKKITANASEKNSYIRDDLGAAWPGFSRHLKGHARDSHGRTIIEVKKVFGKGRVCKKADLGAIVLLTRDKRLPAMQKLSANQALEYMKRNSFCNPHLLVKNRRKNRLREEFFLSLFGRLPVYLLNTIETPAQSLERIERVAR